MDDFTCKWETLDTRVPRLSTKHLVKSYITGLKPHIQNELKLHDITTMEDVISKAKAAKKKFERSFYQNLIRFIQDKKKAIVGFVETSGHQDTNA